jgi:hypothetical protein
MVCDRCGVVNRAGRIDCVQCLAPLTGAKAGGNCKEHPDIPATGRCVTCGTLVCDSCGGVVGNRAVYCIEHTPVITSATGASPGMNPMLGGGGGAPARVASRKSSNSGLIAAIVGALGLIVLVVGLLVWPGPLKSKELPPPPGAAAGTYGPGGGYGTPGGYGSPYGMPGGYGPPGYAPPGGPSGYAPPGGPMPPGGPVPGGAPNGPGGPPGMPSGK